MRISLIKHPVDHRFSCPDRGIGDHAVKNIINLFKSIGNQHLTLSIVERGVDRCQLRSSRIHIRADDAAVREQSFDHRPDRPVSAAEVQYASANILLDACLQKDLSALIDTGLGEYAVIGYKFEEMPRKPERVFLPVFGEIPVICKVMCYKNHILSESRKADSWSAFRFTCSSAVII